MKILCHLDLAVLERELVQRLAAAGKAHPERGPLVVVPSARLREHVQRRLLESERAWLGLEVLHFRGLARRILEAVGEREPRMISTQLLDALLGRIVRDERENVWGRFVSRRPGALRAVSRAFRELRDSGIGPDEFEACIGAPGPQSDLVPLYWSYCGALAGLGERGWVDDAGLIDGVLPHAESFARGRPAILLHGAYELIGIHLDLVRALDRGREVVALLPSDPEAPATAYAQRFAARHLAGDGAPERLEASDEARMLAALWNEESRPEPDKEARFVFRHTQGAAAEVKLAVRLALAAVHEGCRPDEVLIVARGLTPYTEAIEATFEDEKLPWSTSMAAPLRRQPVVHDLMLLLEILADDFPRRATAEALRSPRVRWKSLVGASEPPRGDRADRWSRRAGIVGGFEEWTEVLEGWASEIEPGGADEDEARRESERRVEEAQRIGRALTALRERIRPDRARRWSEHADELGELADELFHPADEDGVAALETFRALLAEMRGMESLAGETRLVGFAEMVRWLGEAVGGSELALRHDTGGLRVLDAMQARGLTCRRLILLGMNSGQFPHPPREDPVLSDALRARLRERTGRPIPVKSEGAAEERMLLGMLLGAVSERVDVSWQRADESGRGRTPSLALRELARLHLGRPDLERLVEGAEHVPSHPEQWLEWLDRRQRLMDPGQARLLTVFRAGRPSPELATLYPELRAGLTQLDATESFSEVDASYDARVEPTDPAHGAWSVSALETLGTCPLKHFFAHRLRVRELDEEAGAFEITVRDLGGLVHRLLEEVYDALASAGCFDGVDPDELARRGRTLVEERWRELMGGPERRISRRAPVLWGMLERSWLEAIQGFVRRDLERIGLKGWGAPRLEHDVEGEVELAGGVRLPVRGRFDRRFDPADGPVIGDYKTGKIDALGKITGMLKGRRLQVPLYWLLAGPTSTVEILGVGPTHFDAADEDYPRSRFSGFERGADREGFMETLGTLAGLLAAGRFPLNPDTHCGWCDWSLACRLRHPPTLERTTHAPDTVEYRLTLEKNTQGKQTLALLRAKR